MPPAVTSLRVVDSHTAGEPTRVVLSGVPDLGDGLLSDRARRFTDAFDRFRTAVVCEPRGADVWVGALVVPPHDPACAVGVIFFNNVGTLGMCGHGTIGLVATLAHLGQLAPGTVRIDTPVGPVEATLHPDGQVSVENVPSFRLGAKVAVDVPGHGVVRGDVAWGGNAFFLVSDHSFAVVPAEIEAMMPFCGATMRALDEAGIRGPDGRKIDHVELFAPTPTADSRSFVLCPGGAYDRSPCGTGTSAKLACLAAEGTLAEGVPWVQESVIGSQFTASYRRLDAERIAPTITGRAFVTAESTLLVHPDDPFAFGIPSAEGNDASF